MIRGLFRIVTTLAAVLICMAALIFIVGYGVDFFSTSSIKKEAGRALDEFARLDRDDDGNAWEYYLKAIHLMETRTFDKAIDTYLAHSVPLSNTLERELNRHEDLSTLLHTGAVQTYCRIPVDYEKGLHAVLPNYKKLMECVKILNAQILVALERGNRGRALRKIKDGFTVSRHVLNGTPIMLNYMMGFRMLNLFSATLDIALSTGTFDHNDLTEILELLRDYDRTIPPTLWVLEAENSEMKIMMSTIPPLYPLLDQVEIMKATILDELGIRLVFWRYGFSAKLAALSAVREMDGMLAVMRDDEVNRGSIEDDVRHAGVFDEFLRTYKPKNDIMKIFATNWRGLFVTRTHSLTRIRLLHSAAVLWLYRLEHGEFPAALAESELSGITDPYTSKPWEYITTEDVVTLKSPGPDLVFDNQDDLSITLYKQSVADYLQQIRR